MLREFRWNVIVRVIAITALSIFLAYVVTNKEWFFTPLVISILIALLIWNLIYYIERTNKDLTYFILSIKQGGFTSSFSDNQRGRNFKKLTQAFNDVIEEFQKLNIQKESHYQYLKMLTESMPIGVISLDPDGKVQLTNPAARSLLNLVRLSHVDDLKKVSARLYETINMLKSGERQTIRTVIGEKEFQLSAQSHELIIGNAGHKIIVIQDLKSELEDKEVDAWQKLIRVLTHEIMNSVTPIVSLTEAMNSLLTDQKGGHRELIELDEEDKKDLFGSLKTIENRSRGLLKFVNAYKDFTKTPDLKFTRIDLRETIDKVVGLMDGSDQSIIWQRPGFHVYVKADPDWMEQVLINVVKNAIEATTDNANRKVTISVRGSEKFVNVFVTDNGIGMDHETLEKAFIPFFTTKKTGTGIGLSLSRQILKLHNGNLTLSSQPGEGTQAVLSLPTIR